MAETSVSNTLLIGAVGGAITAAIQYAFRRYGETQQQRRENVETHLLQLQNSAESLYYRARNLLEKSGRSVMEPDYYVKTSAFAFGRVLAHEQQLTSKGVYAKLNRSTRMKREIKARLHAINLTMLATCRSSNRRIASAGSATPPVSSCGFSSARRTCRAR